MCKNKISSKKDVINEEIQLYNMETPTRLGIVLNVLIADQIRQDFLGARVPNPGFFTISGFFRTGLIQKKCLCQ